MINLYSIGPPTNGVDNAPNGNLGAENPGVYENLPFHGLQQPPNKVLYTSGYLNDNDNGSTLIST